jgi:hypothetical protein
MRMSGAICLHPASFGSCISELNVFKVSSQQLDKIQELLDSWRAAMCKIFPIDKSVVTNDFFFD